MDKTNTGMHFADPTNTIEVRKTSDLFVDDTATGVSSNQIKDGRSALEHLQEDEQKHAFLLYSTGHLLALYKCMFYFFQFCIKGTKFVHTNISESPGELHLRPKYGGHSESIKRLEPNKAHKTLGCHPAVDGSQTEQFKIIKKYIKQWMRRIHSAPLNKADKVHTYRTNLEKNCYIYCPHAVLITSSVQFYSTFTVYNAITIGKLCTYLTTRGIKDNEYISLAGIFEDAILMYPHTKYGYNRKTLTNF